MRPTTFVLGAGVSMPFGFPSGLKLFQTIADTSPDVVRNKMLYNRFRNAVQAIDGRLFVNFIQDLRNCGLSSVDRFIQDCEDIDGRDAYGKIASAFIAHFLLLTETHSAQQSILHNFKNREENVYLYLWDRFAQSGDTLKELKKHRFITFNYDRVLEFFLYQTLRHNFNFNTDEALEEIDSLKICHVYGSLGEFDSHFDYKDVVRGVEEQAEVKTLQKAVHSLKLMTTTRSKVEAGPQIVQHFKDTERVVVLGFGYDETNCTILRDCYQEAYPAKNTDMAIQNMGNKWFGSMYLKHGATLRRAKRLLHLDAFISNDFKRNHIGDIHHKDTEFLEAVITD